MPRGAPLQCIAGSLRARGSDRLCLGGGCQRKVPRSDLRAGSQKGGEEFATWVSGKVSQAQGQQGPRLAGEER